MKDKKDSIEYIVNHLKSREEIPYREGAWEDFRRRYLVSAKRPAYIWGAAAAILLVLGVAGWWYLEINDKLSLEVPMVATNEMPQRVERPATVEDRVQRLPQQGTPDAAPVEAGLDPVQKHDDILSRAVAEVYTMEQQHLSLDIRRGLPFGVSLPPAEFKHSGNLLATVDREDLDMHRSLPPYLGYQNISSDIVGKEIDGQSKNVRFSDRFSLGLIVSPSATNQRTSFGGGLLLSYNIGKNFSVRTGATYSQYEVQTLKDPAHPDIVEVAKAPNPESAVASDRYAASSLGLRDMMPIIPNVNGVSGIVQTLDIPLEARYTVYKGFYATTGVSYAAVLGQRRYAHYIENVNATPFDAGLPNSEREMQSAVTPVTRVMESENTNVRTNGFGGFVNMSVGKELKVNPKVSLMVEPFVKMPIGNFRHADMNYRNGGVRIITNF